MKLIADRDVQRKPVKDALPEIESQGFIALLDQVYRTGEPTGDASGRIDGIFVLVTDVTDRARAEAALRISNWQLGEVIGIVPEAVDLTGR